MANYSTGQILVDGMFADQIDNQITFAGRVPDDCGATDPPTNKPEQCVAITISVDQVHGVAGVIVPGDNVNILVQPETQQLRGARPRGKGGIDHRPDAGPVSWPRAAPSSATRPACLYQAAKVLFVDKTAVPQPGEVSANGSNTPRRTVRPRRRPTPASSPSTCRRRRRSCIASIAPDELYLTLLPTNYTPEPLPPDRQLPGDRCRVRIRRSSRHTGRPASRTNADRAHTHLEPHPSTLDFPNGQP